MIGHACVCQETQDPEAAGEQLQADDGEAPLAGEKVHHGWRVSYCKIVDRAQRQDRLKAYLRKLAVSLGPVLTPKLQMEPCRSVPQSVKTERQLLSAEKRKAHQSRMHTLFYSSKAGSEKA